MAHAYPIFGVFSCRRKSECLSKGGKRNCKTPTVVLKLSLSVLFSSAKHRPRWIGWIRPPSVIHSEAGNECAGDFHAMTPNFYSECYLACDRLSGQPAGLHMLVNPGFPFPSKTNSSTDSSWHATRERKRKRFKENRLRA
jgi:hypothetical protein